MANKLNTPRLRPHLNHQVIIQQQHPHTGLYCAQCRYRSGKRAGKPVWLSWLTQTEASAILEQP
jgi:hypothetical protein